MLARKSTLQPWSLAGLKPAFALQTSQADSTKPNYIPVLGTISESEVQRLYLAVVS